MMDAFDRFVRNKAGVTFYPKHLQSEIDSVNEWIYETVNNGFYQAGFATSQTAYEDAVFPLFKSLDRIEGMLSKSDYLVGNTLTEADIRLWTTIIRFDPVYHGHFKCNIKGIEKDYPNILKPARRIYQMPKVAATVDILYVKKGYFCSQVQVILIRSMFCKSSIRLLALLQCLTNLLGNGHIGCSFRSTLLGSTLQATAPTWQNPRSERVHGEGLVIATGDPYKKKK